MIPFDEIDRRLVSIGKDRKWLSEITGRSAGAIRSSLAPNASPQHRSELLQKALSTAIEIEEATQQAAKASDPELDRQVRDLKHGPALVLRPSEEVFHRLEQAALREGKTLTDWATWAVDEFERMESSKKQQPPNLTPLDSPAPPPNVHFLPFLGAVAAGQPVEAPRHDETIPVPREFPAGHFVVEINGQSGEPHFIDGDRWIIDGRDCYTPKSGKPCIVSDGTGSYLKKWNRKRGVFESINPDFPDVVPAEGAKLQGYPVQKL